MKEYHKIYTIWNRDVNGKIIPGEYSRPIFEYLKDNLWVFTEKVDGTNIRVYWDGKAIKFGGRTDVAQIHAGLVDHLRVTFTEEKMKAVFGESEACLYGEGFGAKIQKGGGNYYADRQSFVLFDVMVGKWWLERKNALQISADLGIPMVPVVLTSTLEAAEKNAMTGITSDWGNFQMEGLVGKPLVDILDRSGDRVVVKMKTKDYAFLVCKP